MGQRYTIHLKQLGTIIAVALLGLSLGSFVSVKGAKESSQIPFSPLPSPSAPPIADSLSDLTTPLPMPSQKPATAKKAPAPKKSPLSPNAVKRPFLWGVTILPYPFIEGSDLFLPEQFRLASELGLRAVRVEYSVNNDSVNQQVVELAKKHNLQLIFIIPFGPNDIFTDQKLQDNAYQYVKKIVEQYKGQVPVWQLATEVASVAIVDGGHHGVDRVDYPEAKYQAVATWLKGATKAVRDADPAAKRLVNDQWIHVGFFDRFLAEGGDFDILGWNWFSDMGTDMERVTIDAKKRQTYRLLTKLKSFKKDIWLTEVNRRLGSKDGKEKEQADYIQTMAEKTYANPAIKGFFVFNLVEDQSAPPQEQGYSLVNIDKEKNWVGGLKLAFWRYQGLIKAKQ